MTTIGDTIMAAAPEDVAPILDDLTARVGAALDAVAAVPLGGSFVIATLFLALIRRLHPDNPDLIDVLHAGLDASMEQVRREMN